MAFSDDIASPEGLNPYQSDLLNSITRCVSTVSLIDNHHYEN